MPNHVINEVLVKGAVIEELRGIALNDEDYIDFELLLPRPLNYWQGNEGAEHEKNFPGLGMQWAEVNWGTKWNAYGQGNSNYRSVVQSEAGVVLTFKTAWSFPRGWVTALFNKTQKELNCAWLSEGGWAGYSETFKIDAVGEYRDIRWSKDRIEDGSSEHKRLHKLLWGVEEFPEEDE